MTIVTMRRVIPTTEQYQDMRKRSRSDWCRGQDNGYTLIETLWFVCVWRYVFDTWFGDVWRRVFWKDWRS
jgi:hypothetical protein